MHTDNLVQLLHLKDFTTNEDPVGDGSGVAIGAGPFVQRSEKNVNLAKNGLCIGKVHYEKGDMSFVSSCVSILFFLCLFILINI